MWVSSGKVLAYLLQLSKIRRCVFLRDAVLPCFASVVGRALGCTLFFFGDMGSPQALLPMGFGFLEVFFWVGLFVIVEDSRLVGIVILAPLVLGHGLCCLLGGFLVKCRELVALWLLNEDAPG